MSSPDDRLSVIQGNYLDALKNEPQDLAQAGSPSQVTAIQANLGNAKNAYFTAIAAALTNNNDKVETAYTAAQQALAAVKQARTDAASIATVIQKLAGATDAATNLLNLAKQVA